MPKTKINIKELKEFFKDFPSFTNTDLHNYFNSIENEISLETLNWRIHYLVSRGILKRIGHGRFTISKTENYFPESLKLIDSINKKVKREFPTLSYCLWSSTALNEFLTNKPENLFIIIVTIFDFLWDKNKSISLSGQRNDEPVRI